MATAETAKDRQTGIRIPLRIRKCRALRVINHAALDEVERIILAHLAKLPLEERARRIEAAQRVADTCRRRCRERNVV